MNAAIGVTAPHGAVTATRPASTPLPIIARSGLPDFHQIVIVQNETTGDRRQQGVDGDGHDALVGAQLGTGVEAEPAEPQDEHAEDRERNVVAGDRPRLSVGAVLADPRPERHRSHQGSDATGHVHDAGPGEVRVRRASPMLIWAIRPPPQVQCTTTG